MISFVLDNLFLLRASFVCLVEDTKLPTRACASFVYHDEDDNSDQSLSCQRTQRLAGKGSMMVVVVLLLFLTQIQQGLGNGIRDRDER